MPQTYRSPEDMKWLGNRPATQDRVSVWGSRYFSLHALREFQELLDPKKEVVITTATPEGYMVELIQIG